MDDFFLSQGTFSIILSPDKNIFVHVMQICVCTGADRIVKVYGFHTYLYLDLQRLFSEGGRGWSKVPSPASPPTFAFCNEYYVHLFYICIFQFVKEEMSDFVVAAQEAFKEKQGFGQTSKTIREVFWR